MNLRHGARGPRDLLQRARRPVDSGRRRADARRWPRSSTGRRIQGFAVDAGSRTYHTAILARSLKVPGRRRPARRVARDPAGTPVDPRRHDRRGRRSTRAGRDRRRAAPRAAAAQAAAEPPRGRRARSTTADGVTVRLQANVELLEDLPSCCASTAPRASACIARSSCSPAGRSTAPPRTRSTRSTAACSSRWRRSR